MNDRLPHEKGFHVSWDQLHRDARALAWRMDGKPLGRGAVLEWLPWPGRHTLELVDAQGLVLDTVRFEVRGAGVAPGAVPGTASKPR